MLLKRKVVNRWQALGRISAGSITFVTSPQSSGAVLETEPLRFNVDPTRPEGYQDFVNVPEARRYKAPQFWQPEMMSRELPRRGMP